MPRTVKLLTSCAGVGLAALGLAACAGNGDTEPTPATTTVTATVSPLPDTTTTAVPPPTTGSTRTVTTTQTPEDRCDPVAFQRSGAEFIDTVLYCDGEWARAGLSQSDYVELFTWSGDRWNAYEADGESPVTGYRCYDRDRLVENGAPAYVLENALLCET